MHTLWTRKTMKAETNTEIYGGSRGYFSMKTYLHGLVDYRHFVRETWTYQKEGDLPGGSEGGKGGYKDVPERSTKH